jgi:hypothetical protein
MLSRAPKGGAEGTHIDDYVVEDHADKVIDWAKRNGYTPHVARVGHVSDKKKADHWRAV